MAKYDLTITMKNGSAFTPTKTVDDDSQHGDIDEYIKHVANAITWGDALSFDRGLIVNMDEALWVSVKKRSDDVGRWFAHENAATD